MSIRPRIVPGSFVRLGDSNYEVLDYLGLNQIVVRHLETGDVRAIEPSELSPIDNECSNSDQHLRSMSKQSLALATKRYEIIRPLLDVPKHLRKSEAVQLAADAAGKNMTTIYRWISRYEQSGRLSSLATSSRSDKGKTRTIDEVESIIQEVISEFYLTTQQYSIVETAEEVKLRCRKRGLQAPHPNTIRNRILHLSEKLRMTKRVGYKAAREKFEPIRGSFPDPGYPYSVVQIDHTPVDLIVVDDVERLPIGRPYLTIAIDCTTRMIGGFCLTLDPPGALSAGLCIAQAMLPKDNFLAKYGIATSWPIWGPIQKIYLDNAKEFRGKMLERACDEYEIERGHRPKGIPNYGGHVERAFLTFMQKTHSLEGTTRSNVQERGDYDSEGRACMTLTEFEHWFTVFLVEVYHQKGHQGISNIPPIKAYEQAILGSGDKPGIGLPQRFSNEEHVRLAFTPYVERTIQEYGVVIDKIHYYNDALRRWVHSRDPNNAKLKRKFIFVRDPRDISIVYFWDPEIKDYFKLPYSDSRRPAISLWELKRALSFLEKDAGVEINEDLIFQGIERMREIEREAIGKTKAAKSARRQEQRRRQNIKSAVHLRAGQNLPTEKEEVISLGNERLEVLTPFEIEEAE